MGNVTAKLMSSSDPKIIHCASEILKRGDLVVFPTDTVYGIGAAVDQPEAVAQLYVAKGRPLDRPIPVLISSFDQLMRLARNIDDRVERFLRDFWPGGLTVVLDAAEWLPTEIVGETGRVGLRMPDHPVALKVIAAAGGALATTSANRSGEQASTTATGALQALGDQVSLVIDDGSSPVGTHSTVVSIDGGQLTILRIGAIDPRTIPAHLPD